MEVAPGLEHDTCDFFLFKTILCLRSHGFLYTVHTSMSECKMVSDFILYLRQVLIVEKTTRFNRFVCREEATRH